MSYTKLDIWIDLSELQATCIGIDEKNKEIRKIMKRIDRDIK